MDLLTKIGAYRTRDGRSAEVTMLRKPGMHFFKVFGALEGHPCHWTEAGRFRMDGIDDDRDLVEHLPDGSRGEAWQA